MSSVLSAKTGVLLLNIGSPDEPSSAATRVYLRSFLMDPRILSIPVFFRFLLVYLIIVPFRAASSAKKYAKIWKKEGSPLTVTSLRAKKLLQEKLGEDFLVEQGLAFGKPAIHSAVEKLYQAQVKRIVVLPLFPQYASATTASVLVDVYGNLKNFWHQIPLTVVPQFYDNPFFVEAWVKIIQKELEHFDADFLLFSYHGLPVDHLIDKRAKGQVPSACQQSDSCCAAITAGNAYCYRAQCVATTKLILDRLAYKGVQIKSNFAFQSRLGRGEWLKPYTTEVLNELHNLGYKKLAVICPAFVADCLETLEEIGMELKVQWLSYGGKEFLLVPSLNTSEPWIETMRILVEHSVKP